MVLVQFKQPVGQGKQIDPPLLYELFGHLPMHRPWYEKREELKQIKQ